MWTAPVHDNQLTSYNVTYGISDLPERVSVIRPSILTFLTALDLEEGTEYVFVVRGVYLNGVEGQPLVGMETTSEASE